MFPLPNRHHSRPYPLSKNTDLYVRLHSTLLSHNEAKKKQSEVTSIPKEQDPILPPPSGTLQRRERTAPIRKKKEYIIMTEILQRKRTAPDALTKASVTSSYPRWAFLLLGLFANDCRPGGVFTMLHIAVFVVRNYESVHFAFVARN